MQIKIIPAEKSLKHKLLLAVPLVLNYGFTIASIWTGWYFYIDEFNVYVRGNLFIIFSAISYSYFVYATVISLASVRKRDAAEKQDGYALASFLILPLIGSIFQVAFYGLSIVGVTFALSLLLVFFSVQDKQINIDFLTQLNNRRKMNEYLAVKTKNISNGKRLFAIMIDIDDFKSINDRFGHEVGDEALRCTANILRKASRTVNGFVARMSGDEFMIFFESDSTKNVLDFERLIESAFADFSSLSSRYPLAASMGCAEFGADGIDSPDKLLKAADEMMYINKTKRKHLNKEFSSGQECAELEN